MSLLSADTVPNPCRAPTAMPLRRPGGSPRLGDDPIARRVLASRTWLIVSAKLVPIPTPERRATDLQRVGDVLRASATAQRLRDELSELGIAVLACLPKFSKSPLGHNSPTSYRLCECSTRFRARTGGPRRPARLRVRRVRSRPGRSPSPSRPVPHRRGPGAARCPVLSMNSCSASSRHMRRPSCLSASKRSSRASTTARSNSPISASRNAPSSSHRSSSRSCGESSVDALIGAVRQASTSRLGCGWAGRARA